MGFDSDEAKADYICNSFSMLNLDIAQSPSLGQLLDNYYNRNKHFMGKIRELEANLGESIELMLKASSITSTIKSLRELCEKLKIEQNHIRQIARDVINHIVPAEFAKQAESHEDAANAELDFLLQKILPEEKLPHKLIRRLEKSIFELELKRNKFDYEVYQKGLLISIESTNLPTVLHEILPLVESYFTKIFIKIHYVLIKIEPSDTNNLTRFRVYKMNDKPYDIEDDMVAKVADAIDLGMVNKYSVDYYQSSDYRAILGEKIR